MRLKSKYFCKISLIAAMLVASTGGFAAQAPNPRAGNSGASSVRSDNRDVRNAATVSRSSVRRNTANITGRTTVSTGGVRGVNASRGAVKHTVTSLAPRSGVAVNMSRAATPSVARSAARILPSSPVRTTTVAGGASRASNARATALFDDISKIGGGYAACREAYATCMDQFCGKANDTYRRCFCSSRFEEFRSTELALDQAKTLLLKFEDNNLNAVDKTAAEVNAMYSATVGEQAIKNDTSGAQSILNEIGDLLSGKKKVTEPKNDTSLGLMSLDFSSDIDDIWGGGGSSIFDTGNSTPNMTELDGLNLYNSAHKQCLAMIAENCENNATLNMAQSAYNIMITQDCNAYEKKIDAQRESVKQTVRTAEKYLRDARLEEYRSHNSADVNECVGKVKAAMLADTACGENYKRCLDYSGAFINPNTGEPIYSSRLFQLGNLILLNGTTGDVLAQNPKFNSFLDEKRMFAATALDTCRDMADTVWTEFKRSALIEIAQAQDVALEEVKMSCVSTMKECYDTQSGALKSFDDTTAQVSGALAAYASKAMCQDKVTACAALYGDNTSCTFDGNGKLTSDAKSCGLSALLAFVDTVDTVRVAEGCETAIDSYLKQLCTPTTGDKGYPWNCRLKKAGTSNDDPSSKADASVAANIKNFALQNCSDPTKEKKYENLPLQTRTQIDKSITTIKEQLEYMLMNECEGQDGYWLAPDEEGIEGSSGKLVTNFYSSLYGSRNASDVALSWGRCVENTTRLQCLQYNTPSEGEDETKTNVATYNLEKDECTFALSWFQTRCALLGNGYFEDGVCYVKP